jgi:hypothetical protein
MVEVMWFNKTKIKPNNFVKFQLDKIFCNEFDSTEINNLKALKAKLTSDINIDEKYYLKELRNAICNIFEVAWSRGISHDIFINYSSLIIDDPRIKQIHTEAYFMCLSRAKEKNMTTFSYITTVFLNQLGITKDSMNEVDYNKLYIAFGTYFQSLFMAYEDFIKEHKFIIK